MNGLECMLSKSAYDIKLPGVADILKDKIKIKKELDKL